MKGKAPNTLSSRQVEKILQTMLISICTAVSAFSVGDKVTAHAHLTVGNREPLPRLKTAVREKE